MSETQQGPGWWQATDGKWYPPESHPLYPGATAPPAYPLGPGIATPPGYRPHPGSSAPPGYSAPPAGYPQWGPGYPPYGSGAPARPTNGLAVASFVCSVAGIIPFFFGVTCVVGIILGFVALSQIKRTGGVQQGRGLAIAGVIVGFSLIAIFFVVVIAAGVSSHQ